MAIDSKNLLVWVKAMSRGQALPLDASEIYESMTDAEIYASSAIAYAGQTIKVKMDDGKYHTYILQPSASGYVLEEVLGGGNGGSDISKVIVDDVLSATSTNPVQNKVVYTEIDALKILVGDTPVSQQIEKAKSLETTPDDIMAWMSEESIITPVASSSGQVYLTNDNKILIL